MSTASHYLTADEAAKRLGVKKETLYAYTSRGQLHSEPALGRPKERRYRAEDIERLRERKDTRRDPAAAASRGLNWGSPVLDSRITLVQDGKLYFRGKDALQLARTATLEEVAELLWLVEPGEQRSLFRQPSTLTSLHLRRLRAWGGCSALTLMQAALPLAAARDLASHDLRPAAVRQAGGRIVRLLATIASGRFSTEPIHVSIQRAWTPHGAAAAREAIRMALVLCADHELNVSAFTARCVASAGASPYDAIAAAVAALKGSRHGGEAARVEALFTEAKKPQRANSVIANRLQRAERIPGFGHPLYPAGDPRAALLLQTAEASGNKLQWRSVVGLLDAGAQVLRESPNLDFGLTALCRCYRLPQDAPIILFALGRATGWIAHAMEQYESGRLIRPRARYIGPAAETGVDCT